MNKIATLAKIANRLDSIGLTREADVLDSFIRKIAAEPIPVQDPAYPEEEEDDYGSDEVEPDIEEKHFGFSLDAIGKKITKALELWNPENPVIYRKWTQSEFISKIVNDPNFKFLGEGSFRMVFSYGNEYVIKVASPNAWLSHSQEMNREDAMFGRMPKYSDLFPKVYEADPAYKWIIMDKCTVINHESEFLKFFPNPVIDSFNLFPVGKIELFSYALRSCVYKETKDEAEILGHTAYLVNQLKDKFGISSEEIIGSYESLTLFNKIVDFCKEFGALPGEIRLGNVGISSDGRFVIIDSSVEETIKNIFK